MIRRLGARALRRTAESLSRWADELERVRTDVPEARIEPAEADPAAPPARKRLGTVLFALSLVVFAVSRVVGLESFPIYFFCDEAVLNVRAAELVRNGGRDAAGRLLPTYFDNAGAYNISVSVYAQVPLLLLLGRSIFVTRLTEVLVALSGAAAVSLILLRIFRLRFWWVGSLLLAVTPAWFLHSRTAFGCSMAASFYAWFLYFYLRYRVGRRGSIYASLFFGALAFYTYSAMQLVVVLSGLLLLLSDLPYHLRHWKRALTAIPLLGLLLLPYVRFQRANPEDTQRRLKSLGSYWVDGRLTMPQKLGRFGQEYLFGLSPGYWYRPDHPRDLIRHQMKGYGNILPMTLPFALAGFLLCLRWIRSPTHRALLVALLAAPAGGALAEVGVTRALVYVVPAAVLTGLGLELLLSLLTRWVPVTAVAIVVFLLFGAGQAAMLADSLRNGPRWSDDYRLFGLQWGAREVFGEVKRILARSPASRVFVSPIWANGADYFREFFFPNDSRVGMRNLDYYALERRPDLDRFTVLVMTPDEYREILADRKFVNVTLEGLLKYPDGNDGFFFVRTEYSPDLGRVLEEEQQARLKLVPAEIQQDGQTIPVAHSRLDMGPIGALFDGNFATMVRTDRVNPAVFELVFPSLRPLRRVTVSTSNMDIELTVRTQEEISQSPSSKVFTARYVRLPENPTVELRLIPPLRAVRSVRVGVRSLVHGEQDHIHVRELRLE